jgi:hypothetical protein
MMMITTNFSSTQIEAAAFVAHNVEDNNYASNNNNNNNGNNNDVTIISGPIYSWIFKYVFDKTHVFSHFRDSSQPIQTKKVLLMTDASFNSLIVRKVTEDEKQIERLKKINNNTDTIATFADAGVYYNYHKYPSIDVGECQIRSGIEVKTNY